MDNKIALVGVTLKLQDGSLLTLHNVGFSFDRATEKLRVVHRFFSGEITVHESPELFAFLLAFKEARD